MQDIAERIIDEQPPTPGRFPTVNQVRQHWFSWLSNHPEKAQPEHRAPCNECDGRGFLWGRKLIEGMQYDFAFRCRYCENWKRNVNDQSPILFSSKANLYRTGYEVRP
jgi:hypothetical protein